MDGTDYSNFFPTGLWAKRAILQPCHLSPSLAPSGNPTPFSKLQEALERGVAWGVRRTEWGLVQKLRDR